MDHLLKAKTAFTARQFLESEAHIKLALSESPEGDRLEILKLAFELAKILRPDKCWLEMRAVAYKLSELQLHDELQDFLKTQAPHVERGKSAFIHELKAATHFTRGFLERSQASAIVHTEILVEKKLTHKMLRASTDYVAWFPHIIYFRLIRLQSLILLDDSQGVAEEIKAISERIERYWSELEDVQESSKQEIMDKLTDILMDADSSNGKNVINLHYASLLSKSIASEKLLKEDWKKLIELLVFDQSWAYMKLGLLLGIANDQVVAQEFSRQLKKKKGYSFVKLTRHDPALKRWMLDLKQSGSGQSSVTDTKAVTIGENDLKLVEKMVEASFSFYHADLFDEEDDLVALENNTIKQLQLQDLSEEIIPDLVVSYYSMGMLKTVGWLLRTYSGQSLGSPLFKKLGYVRIMMAIEAKEFFHALSIVEEMLGDETITLDEYKELMYTKGSIFLANKDYKQAARSFAEVERIDPGYRQIRERMKRFEKN